jgi:hypothetical protein
MKINLSPEELDPADQQGLRPLDRLTAVSLVYLGIPLALFLAGWLKTLFAVPLLLLLCLAFYVAWPFCSKNSPPFRVGLKHIFLLGVAICWVSFGGAGHVMYANRFDWSMRDAVVHDLTAASWPPGYDIGGSVLWFLRSPVGYFLPAALAGKIFGLSIVDGFLWLWTALGVWIFLLLLPLQSRRPGKMVLVIIAVVFFSGMDIVGWLTLWGFFPPLFRHLEWWAQMFQYSSNTTLLFWTPNHALPAWIAAALFWRHWKTDAFITVSPLLLSLLPIWSPFPMIGMLPFYALLVYRVIRDKKVGAFNLPLLGISLLLTFVVAAFLSMDIGNIPSSYAMDDNYFSLFFERYPLFVLLEFGLLTALLWKSNRSPVLLLSVIVLLGAPFIRFGPGNDLAMRGSVPALAFVCMATLDFLQRATKESRGRMIALCSILLLGAVTPFHEFYRAVTFPHWMPSTTLTVMDFGPIPPPHYVGRHEQTWRQVIFRDPAGILKTTLPREPMYFRPEEYP